jgi:hypothetical protein
MPMPNLREAGPAQRNWTLLAFVIAAVIVVVIITAVH